MRLVNLLRFSSLKLFSLCIILYTEHTIDTVCFLKHKLWKNVSSHKNITEYQLKIAYYENIIVAHSLKKQVY